MPDRKKAQKDQAGGSQSLDMAYSDSAGAFKTLNGFGSLTPIGALATAYPAPAGTAIAVFNSDTAVHYVKFGAAGLTAPTGPADGVPIPPGALIVLNYGIKNVAARADSALVFGYLVGDETFVTTNYNDYTGP